MMIICGKVDTYCVGVFTNFNTVPLQFYAQFHSDSIQIYRGKNI